MQPDTDRAAGELWISKIRLIIVTYELTKVKKLVQAAYKEEMFRRHGADCDWQNMPIDAGAVHASGGGKAHGR